MMGAKTPINLQDGHLNQVRKDSTVVNVFLINGCKLRGVVRGFDSFTIVLESEGKQHLLQTCRIYCYSNRVCEAPRSLPRAAALNRLRRITLDAVLL